MPPKADKKAAKPAKKDDDWGDEPAVDEWTEGSNEGGKDGDPFESQPSLDRQVSDPFKASKDAGDDGWGDDGDTKAEKKEDKDSKLDADEEDELDEAADTPTGAPGLERQKSFRVLDVKDIAKRRQAMIAKAKNLLYVTESDAAALLSYFRWKFQSLQSAWFDNPKKTREKAGLVAEEEDVKDSKSEQSKAGGKKRQCETAFCDEVDEDQGLALPCGHFYCNTCWAVMIKSEIEKGPSCINAMCYGMRVGSKNETIKCREAIPYELFEKYCSETEMAKYTRWLLDSYVECSGVIKWCPKPGCKYAVEYTQGGPKEITCRCGHVFCFLCGSTPHKPAPCDLVKKWRKQAGEDADSAEEATKKLLAAQAKQCPNCKIQIIKDKFCNHMHCTKCGHHFCWLCKKPWSGHSDYYNCSTYKDAAAKGEFSEEENKMMESNKVMQKFMWFKQRYDNCARGVLKARQITKKIEEAEKKGDLDGPAFWLKEIVTQLEECHRMLQWTFCLAYFLKTSGLKTLFEQKQAELVAKVDKFHEFLESTSVKDLFSQMRKAKADAVNVVGSVTYFAELGTDSLMDIIQHEADAESETWACVSCQTANPDMVDVKAKKKATHCKKCTACRVHGEPECRSTLCRK